jgi:CHASE2 domain-containing sensor protein
MKRSDFPRLTAATVRAQKMMLSRRRWLAYAYILAVFVGFLVFSALLHLPHDAEHWSADFVTAKFSKRLKSQHQSIVLVYVSETTLERFPYVSPIDRRLLAELIRAVDEAGAKVIGLDIILDRYTEAEKDEELRQTLRHTKAKMVLGAIDEPKNGPHAQSEFFFATDDGNNPTTGHIYFDERQHSSLVVSDHVVRFIAEQSDEGLHSADRESTHKSFAEALARAAGVDFKPESPYIAWLLPPANGAETFMTLAAEHVLGRGKVTLPVGDLLHDKIVLIGGNFDDRDQHLTPLSVSRDDFYTGAFIHAQVLAQLMDRRSIRETSSAIQWLVASAAGFLGFWLGRKSGHHYLWLELGSVVGLVLIGFLAFWLFAFIFPYNLALIAWLAGAAVGHYGRRESRGIELPVPHKSSSDGGG